MTLSRALALTLGLVIVVACGESDSTAPDHTPPTVSITSPAAGAVTGTITLVASATDAGGMASVSWKVNTALLPATDNTSPYEYTWDTALNGPGIYEWVAVAVDNAGNLRESAPVTYTVAP
jgi:hypothetical protein